MEKVIASLKISLMLFLFLIVFFYTITFGNGIGLGLLFVTVLSLGVIFLSQLSSLKNITIDDFQPMITQIGEKKKIELIVRNYASFYPILFVENRELELNQSLFLFFQDKKEIDSEWIPKERGYIKELTIELQSSDFFSLFKKKRKMTITSEIYVLPQVSYHLNDIKGVFTPKNKRALFGESSYELEKIRPYLLGDSINGIDWKLSSKREQLIYRDYKKQESGQILFLFYGTNSQYFEKMLSLYFGFFQDNKETKYHFSMHGDGIKNKGYVELKDFCTIKNRETSESIPFFKESTVLIFTPERSHRLEQVIKQLAKNKSVQVIDYQTIFRRIKV